MVSKALMKSSCLVFGLPLLLAACGVSRQWQEVVTAPMSRAEAYEGLVFVATSDKYAPDIAECDRGLGTWQSRWRVVTGERFALYRYRLKAEMLIDEGSTEDGWRIRYIVEQQKVEDMRKHRDPEERDWSAAGQHGEAEALIGLRLQYKLAPES